jgi:hypothetical protein
MARMIQSVFGPRVGLAERRRHPVRYAVPGVLLSVARVLLLLSVFLPYWHMELEAPQYPNGLFLTAYVNHLEGDVKEIDGLNHYIGMRPLHEAAKLERTMSVWAVVAMVLLMEGAVMVHSRWAVLLALPAIGFPAGFLVDLQFWMRKFGQNLDPAAPLSASVKPFTPTILGEGGIGQFRTYADLGWGMYLAIAAAVCTVLAFYFHRRAYLPLSRKASQSSTSGGAACA